MVRKTKSSRRSDHQNQYYFLTKETNRIVVVAKHIDLLKGFFNTISMTRKSEMPNLLETYKLNII